MKEYLNKNLIAPCGMNCGICKGYLREKNKCVGCRKMNEYNSDYCRKCIIKYCKTLKEKKMKFCSDKCKKYPCTRLKGLDKRYRTRYGMSEIANLEYIKSKGIKNFLKKEKRKWINKKGVLCVHDKKYYE